MGLSMLFSLRLVMLLLVSAPLAGPRVAARPPEALIGAAAQLVLGGRAADVEVAVRCAPNLVPLEAFVYLTQNGNQSNFAGLPVSCTGRMERYVVRVWANGFKFHVGQAQASAYILLEDPDTGETYGLSPVRTVRLHR